MTRHQSDICIIGGGLAGLACCYDLLDSGKKIVVLDRDTEENLGGLAKESFGGIMLVDSPLQRRSGIKDTHDLAWRDWNSYAKFTEEDVYPKRWAKMYIERSIADIYEWLVKKKVTFLPVVNWPERGLYTPGNSVPRWHVAWGTGYKIIVQVIQAIQKHKNAANVTFYYSHKVEHVQRTNGISICEGIVEHTQNNFVVEATHMVIATGGISGGDLEMVRKHWYKPWGQAPETLLNGAHKYGDGTVHLAAEKIGAHLTHLDKQWHYAAGIQHPNPRKHKHGLSLVPPRSALWMDSYGKRFGPQPLVGYTDTRYFVETITQTEDQYSWLILNMKIAKKELSVSGGEYMTSFRDSKKFEVAKELFFGNTALINRLLHGHEDVIHANSLAELCQKMNALCGNTKINEDILRYEIAYYDDMIDRGPKYYNDDQLRRIVQFRKYSGDKLRVCNAQKILDSGAYPLIAIRCFIISRKSLGGICTDEHARVLDKQGNALEGFYAIGEAAGFGGGGIHGQGSLEGTFLGACILTGRVAAAHIATHK